MAITKPGESQEFAYTGGMQEFTVPQTGLYMLEVWGAQGAAGYATNGTNEMRPAGGSGGYSIGYKVLKREEVLYVCCGGRPYNGGGNGSARTTSSSGGSYSCNGGAGGGATHISVTNTTLANTAAADILIAAGGGGGGSAVQNGYSYAGGSGGGLSGGSGSQTGGSQAGGYARGKGQTGANGAGGGGGGYWGGYSGDNKYDNALSGGGGSGYIGGVPEITYKGQEYAPETKNGAHSGNGKARITFVEKSISLVFAGGKEIIAMYRGNRRITDVKISGGG